MDVGAAVEENPDPADVAVVTEGLRAYNRGHVRESQLFLYKLL